MIKSIGVMFRHDFILPVIFQNPRLYIYCLIFQLGDFQLRVASFEQPNRRDIWD
jgi:hypothetical protein